jgi:hypothetical protein
MRLTKTAEKNGGFSYQSALEPANGVDSRRTRQALDSNFPGYRNGQQGSIETRPKAISRFAFTSRLKHLFRVPGCSGNKLVVLLSGIAGYLSYEPSRPSPMQWTPEQPTLERLSVRPLQKSCLREGIGRLGGALDRDVRWIFSPKGHRQGHPSQNPSQRHTAPCAACMAPKQTKQNVLLAAVASTGRRLGRRGARSPAGHVNEMPSTNFVD